MNNLFEETKERFNVIHLAGIGRFCKCGCGKRIEGVIVTKKLKHSTIRFRRVAANNKVFANRSHKDNYENRFKTKTHNRSLYARISLVKQYTKNNKTPYYELRIYKKKGIKESFEITKSNIKLFEFIESIVRFRQLKSETKSTEQHTKKDYNEKIIEELKVD